MAANVFPRAYSFPATGLSVTMFTNVIKPCCPELHQIARTDRLQKSQDIAQSGLTVFGHPWQIMQASRNDHDVVRIIVQQEIEIVGAVQRSRHGVLVEEHIGQVETFEVLERDATETWR